MPAFCTSRWYLPNFWPFLRIVPSIFQNRSGSRGRMTFVGFSVLKVFWTFTFTHL